MGCDCQFCRDYTMLEEIQKKYKFTKVHKMFINRMFSQAMHESESAGYYKAILDGWWPSSVDILIRALKRAKEHKE